jgi:hypothetical protein
MISLTKQLKPKMLSAPTVKPAMIAMNHVLLSIARP